MVTPFNVGKNTLETYLPSFSVIHHKVTSLYFLKIFSDTSNRRLKLPVVYHKLIVPIHRETTKRYAASGIEYYGHI